jgi:hypothetical protein
MLSIEAAAPLLEGVEKGPFAEVGDNENLQAPPWRPWLRQLRLEASSYCTEV